MILRKSMLSLLLTLLLAQSHAQQASAWADSVLKSLTPEEKIAQLIMVRLSSIDLRTRIVSFYDTTVERDIQKFNIGGICLFQGAPVKQAALINKFQAMAKTPILMAIDGETGVGMRLDSVVPLPKMMMLGALRDSSIAFRYGQWVAAQCKQLGLQINFAPVADVNNNPNNPVINDRSFGENKEKVATMAVQYMLGMKSGGIMGSAKHFPGHGDVDVDSHLSMPVISKSREQLNNLELYPFRRLFDAGVGSAMVGHLFIPVIDSNANRASSISPKIVTGLLRDEMGFKGLTFTDALEMKGVAEAFPNGGAGVESLVAGNDMLCLPGDVETVINKVKEAIAANRISWQDVEAHARKILMAKYESGLTKWKPVSLEGLTERLNAESDALKKEVAEKAITLAKYDDKKSFPITGMMGDGNWEKAGAKIALLDVAKNRNTAFALAMRRQYNADIFMFDHGMTAQQADSLYSIINGYDQVMMAIHELPRYPANNFNMSAASVELINRIGNNHASNLFIFGNPYAAKSFCGLKNIIIGYDDDPITQETGARMLAGEISPEGQLPVTICEALPAGKGEVVLTNRVTTPKNTAVNASKRFASDDFQSKIPGIDAVINDAINRKAMPGAALLVLKDGKLVLEKTYGNLSYNSLEKVSQETVWDMASVTKICATTLSVMKLYDEGKIELNKTLGDYLPWVKGTNKEKLVIRDILLHEAGLKAWIPFYKEIADSVTMKALPGYFSKKQSERFGIKVDDSLYMRTDWRDTMISRILTSTVDNRKNYIYSDNDFIFMGEIVKAVSGQSLDQYAWNHFYRPLGFRSTGFNPTAYINKKTIAPTEQDPYFRERLVRGYVHDPGAAMFGGVSGHAGLFSNAYEIAILMQLVMNKGELNGKRFFKTSTVDLFTAYQSKISRRGLGFDKPEKDNATRKQPYPALALSDKAFGHTGFTGTCAWADPEKGIVFVLHANRVHPEAKNTFGDLNVRGRVMEEIWK